MRHIYLLIVLLTACLSSFASGGTTSRMVNQTNWRWRNNNGSETTATWKGLQNTAVTFNGKGVIRLRIELVNASWTTECGLDGGCPQQSIAVTLTDTLQYSTNLSSAVWTSIGFDTTKAFIIRGAGNRLTQGQVTTQQLADSGHAFAAGRVLVSDTAVRNFTLPADDRTEFEISLQATPHLLPGTVYYFRLKNYVTGIIVNYQPYIYYPQGYPNLKTPAKVSASAFEDDMAVPALATSVNTRLSVVPNPAHSAIGFRLNSSSALLQAILTDASGRMIYQQSFANVQPGVLYKLSLMQQPAPGLYILKVTGSGLSESSKVMVQ